MFGDFDKGLLAALNLSVGLNIFENIAQDFQELFFLNESAV